MGFFRAAYCGTIFYFGIERGERYGRYILNGIYNTEQYAYFHWQVFGLDSWVLFKWAFLGSILMASLGIFARLSLFLSTVFYVLFYYPVSATLHPYDNNLVCFILLILSFSPGIEAFSCDFFLRRSKPEPFVPAWPQRLIVFSLGVVYLAAGTSKLLNTGFSWAEGSILQAYMMERNLLLRSAAIEFVTSKLWLCRILSFSTMCIELGFLPLSFYRRSWPLLAVMGMSMHVGIYFFFGLNFLRFFCPVYLIFFNYEWAKQQWYKLATSK